LSDETSDARLTKPEVTLMRMAIGSSESSTVCASVAGFIGMANTNPRVIDITTSPLRNDSSACPGVGALLPHLDKALCFADG
jgi:hypothetical protein